MLQSKTNLVITKVQKYLVSEVYKEENMMVKMIVTGLENNLKEKSFSEIKYIGMTMSGKEIVEKYY